MAAALTLCTAVGVLTHPWPWLNLASLVVIGVIAAIGCGALKVGPPGAYFFTLVAGVAAYMAQHGQSPVRVVAMTALGGLVAVVVGLLDLVWAPRGAERTALAAAATALDGFEQAAAEELPQARALASQSLHHAWTTVRDGVWGPRDRHIVGMLVALQELQARYERRQAGLAGELAGFEVHPWGVAEGEAAPDASSFGDFSLEQLRDSSLGRPDAFYLLRGALRWPSPMLLVGLRVGLASALAGGLALLIGVDHPYWAAAVAMLVLHQGGSRSSQTLRGVQRLLGTAAGLGLYWLVALWNPHGFWLAGLMFVLQFCIELLVVRNYALAVTFITPLALTIESAAAVVDPVRVVGERALDTVLAVAVALATLWLVGRGTALLMARGQARRVVVALDPVLGALAQGRADTEQAAEDRRHLYFRTARTAARHQPVGGRPARPGRAVPDHVHGAGRSGLQRAGRLLAPRDLPGQAGCGAGVVRRGRDHGAPGDPTPAGPGPAGRGRGRPQHPERLVLTPTGRGLRTRRWTTPSRTAPPIRRAAVPTRGPAPPRTRTGRPSCSCRRFAEARSGRR